MELSEQQRHIYSVEKSHFCSDFDESIFCVFIIRKVLKVTVTLSCMYIIYVLVTSYRKGM